MTEPSERSRERGAGITGTAVWGCIVTGFSGLAFAWWGVLTGQGAMAGIPLVAAAVAFGFLANAALRR
jgi:hypothetical protein